MVSVSLYNILTYIGTGSRPLIEGEAVLNAGHVIMCGVNIENRAEIIALCQQTSQLKGVPHSIKIILNSLLPQDWSCVCSCKAGAGGRCKHIVACLLFINRNTLEELSCTDLQQAWGKRKQQLHNLEVEALQHFCHIKQKQIKVEQDIDPSITSNTIEQLLMGAPESEIALHQKRKRTSSTSNKAACSVIASHSTDQVCTIILENLESIFRNFGTKFVQAIPILEPYLETFYNKNIAVSMEEAIHITITTMGQNNNLWKSARRTRITSSRCYQLFTYCNNKNPNWNKKMDAYVNSSFHGNKNTEHGNKFEHLARVRYEKQFGNVYQTGLIINPSLPWLACSPDGIKAFEGKFYRLIEIKCPIKGATKPINDIISSLSYVKYDRSKQYPYILNPKHVYYGQVQLSMAILDIKLCDFVIYSSFADDILVLEVHRDEVFIDNLIRKLHYVYFNHLLNKLWTADH